MRRYLARCLWLLLLLPMAAAAGDCPRIISQAPYITHTLRWLGLEPCIVGVSRYDTLERPRTGGVLDPDAPAIAALHPQLLLDADWIAADTWRQAAPPGATAVRLGGFRSMEEVEENLGIVGRLAGVRDAEDRQAGFRRAWRTSAGALEGGGRRILLLSACGEVPYSFGRATWLYDLFTTAGFNVVETHPTIRHIAPGREIAELGQLIDELRPEIVFAFQQGSAGHCPLAEASLGVRIVPLPGESFLHPAPVLLEGLAALEGQRAVWSSAAP